MNLINLLVFLTRFLVVNYMFGGQFQGMLEEKIIEKLTCQFFFLVGPSSISSEDSSTVEYKAHALKVPCHV